MYQAAYLIGFRGTGKTTIGKMLAQKIGWEFMDMDDIIVQKSGSDINMLTENGTSWVTFRQLEHNVLMELLHKHDIVIGVGGGAPVNDIVQPQSGKTFGELNMELFKNRPEIAVVLLTADLETIKQRIYDDEIHKQHTFRPILDEKKAEQVRQDSQEYKDNPEKQKSIIIEGVIEDSVKMYDIRQPLYKKLTDKIIDTSNITPEQAVDQIIKLIN